MGAKGSKPDFVVTIYTGDRPKAGSNATVTFQMFDENGHSSDIITLDNTFKDDFERGQRDVFEIESHKTQNLGPDGKIGYITLWKDAGGVASDWFVDKIVIDNPPTNNSYVFPVFRWIRSSNEIRIQHLDTSLPQNDRFREQRQRELDEKKKLYEYFQRFPNGPMKVKNMPDDEKFSFERTWDVGLQAIQLEIESGIVKLTKEDDWDSLDDLVAVYTRKHFTKPEAAYRWRNDTTFGFQRVGGLHSTVIALVREIPAKFPVTDELVGPLLEGYTLESLIRHKRLFICDLEELVGIQPSGPNVLCTPMALLFVDKEGNLRPIAIQLFQEPNPDNPIFTPQDDPLLWTYVKMWYNNAEASLHQSQAHLGLTHLLMEGMNIATNRNLSMSHPIFKLLAPHFLYLIAINGPGVDKLLEVDGWVDTTLNCGRDAMIELICKGVNSWRMDLDGTLPELMKSKGLDDPDVLPGYHYRNDGMLVYNAIKKYVGAYVNLYYHTSDTITDDIELQKWVGEIVKDRKLGGCGIKGVPGNGVLTNQEDLVLILTSIIFVCSVRHAAVNFGQYDEYGFSPNYPGWLKNQPPTSKFARVTEEQVVKSLADQARTLKVIKFAKILSTRGTKSLGDFEVQYIFDPPAKEIVYQFRQDLKAISKEIKAKNKKRSPPYPYLDPELVPNSISI